MINTGASSGHEMKISEARPNDKPATRAVDGYTNRCRLHELKSQLSTIIGFIAVS